jgi:catechol 2,3-dioxygenase-like lactoylglutathione lyase family enzyme
MNVERLAFVRVPSRDAKRSRAFYVEKLGLRPDEHSPVEFWVGDTCFAIWEPERHGLEFSPHRQAHTALHVDDFDKACQELEAKGIEVFEVVDTGVCKMAFFQDPDGNALMLHHRYLPQFAGGQSP